MRLFADHLSTLIANQAAPPVPMIARAPRVYPPISPYRRRFTSRDLLSARRETDPVFLTERSSEWNRPTLAVLIAMPFATAIAGAIMTYIVQRDSGATPADATRTAAALSPVFFLLTAALSCLTLKLSSQHWRGFREVVLSDTMYGVSVRYSGGTLRSVQGPSNPCRPGPIVLCSYRPMIVARHDLFRVRITARRCALWNFAPDRYLCVASVGESDDVDAAVAHARSVLPGLVTEVRPGPDFSARAFFH